MCLSYLHTACVLWCIQATQMKLKYGLEIYHLEYRHQLPQCCNNAAVSSWLLLCEHLDARLNPCLRSPICLAVEPNPHNMCICHVFTYNTFSTANQNASKTCAQHFVSANQAAWSSTEAIQKVQGIQIVLATWSCTCQPTLPYQGSVMRAFRVHMVDVQSWMLRITYIGMLHNLGISLFHPGA